MKSKGNTEISKQYFHTSKSRTKIYSVAGPSVMGIRGLTTFMEYYFTDKWLQYDPKSHLVIDGYSICYTLYSGIDWIQGGQYWEYRQEVLEFFHALQASGILPVVVFDGIDYKQVKKEVIWKRRSESVKKIRSQLTPGCDNTDDGSSVIPLQTMQVFREVLEELNIPLYFADGEADPDTVAMAAHYKCPIVANDSDYFMFNADHGYIPLSHFQWQEEPIIADMYTLKQFQNSYKLNDTRLARLIPAILGNDFIPGLFISPFKQYVLWSVRDTVDQSKSYAHIESLVRYIAKFQNVSEVLEDISTAIYPSFAKRVSMGLERAESIYNVTHVLNEEIFMNNTALVTNNGSKLPEWVLRQFRHGYFVPGLMETLVLGESFLRIPTDNPCKPSTQLVSRYIRRSIYSILLPLMKNDCVTEVVRFEADLHNENVSVSPSTTFPSFLSMQKLSLQERVAILCQVIDIDRSVLDTFDRKWKLIVCAGCYWARECHPSIHLVKALILCLLSCSRDKDPSSLLPSQPVREERTSEKWLDALHSFSSFQYIYLDLSKLNNILVNPLSFVSPAFVFDGILIQFYACKKNIDGIAERNLKESLRLYKDLLKIFSSFLAQGRQKGTTTVDISKTIKLKDFPDKTKKCQLPKSIKPPPATISNNPFAMLMQDSSDESVDSSDN